MRTIGVDVGGTKIAAGVVDASGHVLARVSRATPALDVRAIFEAIADVVAGLRAELEVSAVGVAAAGYVDAARSVVLFAPNLPWREEPLRADLQARTGLPVVVENDANAAAWGEFRHGAGRDVDDLVALTVGTGLGGGVVTGGRLVRGAHGVAAELGHLRVVPGGLPCPCGNRGCWEQYASGSALVRRARELARSDEAAAVSLLDLAGGDPAAVTGQMVTQAARAGDPAGVALLAELGRWLGEGSASIAAVLDPALVVVGGGVASAGDLLLEPMRTAFHDHLTARGHRPEAVVVPAMLGNEAGLVGAADQARMLAPAQPGPGAAPGSHDEAERRPGSWPA